MTATRPRHPTAPKGRPVSARRVRGMLLGLAYRLHTTKVIKRLPATDERG